MQNVLSDEKVSEIQGVMLENPLTSLRKLAQQVDVSYNSGYRALRLYIGMRPYKVSLVHKLMPSDPQARLHFCNWLLEVVNHDSTFLSRCFFTDEAWFSLDGAANSQNCRFWSCNNPHIIHEHPLHSSKIGVWAAISGTRVYSLFFETTVNTDTYRGFVEQFVSSLTENEIYTCWFQQDNAPPHTSNSSLRLLDEYFGDRVISKSLWPPRSPDLSPPDFFLWGFLKDRVYANKPTTLLALRQNITAEIERIPVSMLSLVSESVATRAMMCTLAGGEHFQHM
jgi:hypothetical protein